MKVWGILYHVHLSVCPSVDKILCTFIKHWNCTVWINLKTCSYVKVAAGLNRYEVGKFIVGKAFQTLHFTLNLMLVFFGLMLWIILYTDTFYLCRCIQCTRFGSQKKSFQVCLLPLICLLFSCNANACTGCPLLCSNFKINLIPVVFFLISTHFYILVTSYMNLL